MVESLANSEEQKHEVISTEDLLYNTVKHDEMVQDMRMERKRKTLQKMRCMKREERERQEWMMNIIEEIIEDVVGQGNMGRSVPLEEGGYTSGAPIPQDGRGGLLEGGSLNTERPTLQEPTEGGEVNMKMVKKIIEELLQEMDEDGHGHGQEQERDEEHHQSDLLGSDEEEHPGWGNIQDIWRAYDETIQGSSAPHNAGRLAGPEEKTVVPLEERGSKQGVPIPQEGRGGLLEGGSTEKVQSTLQEPTDDDEEDLDRQIELEKEGITEESWKEKMEEECSDCGGRLEDMELCLLGLDVTALFPSMTSSRTAMIVRNRMMRSKMRIDGFDWKIGLVYIVMNKHLTTNIGKLWKILPYRRKLGGTEPGMSSRGMTGKTGKVEEQWCFKAKELSKEQVLEVAARCV